MGDFLLKRLPVLHKPVMFREKKKVLLVKKKKSPISPAMEIYLIYNKLHIYLCTHRPVSNPISRHNRTYQYGKNDCDILRDGLSF